MATIDECIEFALKNIGLWWGYGISRHCDEWKYIIIGRIFESEIILIPPSLKISESSSNGSYRNMDEVWWRYGISRSCDECNFRLFCSDDCRSLYLVKKSVGPMIADQEKINGCVRFAFPFISLFETWWSKVDIYFYVDVFYWYSL
jgi:hypothetical protein